MHDSIESNEFNEFNDSNDSNECKDVIIKKLVKKTNVLFLNNGWNDKNEQVIKKISDICIENKELHDKAMSYNTTMNNVLNIVLILFASSLSVQTFLDATEIKTIVRQVIIYIVNVMTLLNVFLKYGDNALTHKSQSTEYVKLYHNIQQIICLPRKDRENANSYIFNILKKYDELLLGPSIIKSKSAMLFSAFNKSNYLKDTLDKNSIVTNNIITIVPDDTIIDVQNTTISDADVNNLDKNDIDELNKHFMEKMSEWEKTRFQSFHL